MARKSFSIITLLMVMILILVGCVQPEPIPPSAADGSDAATANESMAGSEALSRNEAIPGGVWTRADIADASILNPILHSDVPSANISRQLFPVLFGLDPVTGTFSPTEMAESWSSTEDGLTWTFNLRQDVVWSDGEVVDGNDFKFTYDAVADENVDTPRKSNVESIESIELLDNYTVQVTFNEVRCTALQDLGLRWLPSHLYAADFSDIMDSGLNEAPAVSAGPFIFQSWARGDNIVSVRNDTYFKGSPLMDGHIYKVVPDQDTQLAQLQTQEISVIDNVPPRLIEAAERIPTTTRFRNEGNGYAYIALNMGDPDDPKPGRDEDGNVVEQTPHPILSDKAVRLAIAHSLDYDAIIDDVFLGEGYQIASNVMPALDWAHNSDLEPYAYDPELAASILAEAGWTDSDNDGVLDKDGLALSLTLRTNAGNSTREDLGALVQDQLAAVGFDIDFQPIDFGTLVQQLLGQTFDMVIISWNLSSPPDPDDQDFWSTKFDTPGSGFNFVSYHNPELDELLEQGLAMPGCAPEDRAPIYAEIQRIIHEDIPYVFVTGNVANTFHQTEWGAIDPQTWGFYYNLQDWYNKNLQR